MSTTSCKANRRFEKQAEDVESDAMTKSFNLSLLWNIASEEEQAQGSHLDLEVYLWTCIVPFLGILSNLTILAAAAAASEGGGRRDVVSTKGEVTSLKLPNWNSSQRPPSPNCRENLGLSPAPCTLLLCSFGAHALHASSPAHSPPSPTSIHSAFPERSSPLSIPKWKDRAQNVPTNKCGGRILITRSRKA